jgi:hypothetical protein
VTGSLKAFITYAALSTGVGPLCSVTVSEYFQKTAQVKTLH